LRQSIDNLHDDITQDILESKRVVVDVIDPSPGIWGGDPIEGLVTVVYRCPGEPCCAPVSRNSVHHALYGPTDEDWTPDKGPVEHYSLYAD